MSRAEHWYALEVRPRQEGKACEHVEGFGLGAYVPMCLRSIMVNRHTKRRELREFPIVSRLVFVNSPDPMSPGLARRLVSPVSADSRISLGDMPEGRDARLWARMALSDRNCRPSPVTGIYGAGGIPSEIRVEEIEAMVDANGDHDEILKARHRGEIPEIPAGTPVRMKDGPLVGYHGVVVDGLHNRLNILINILGRESRVEASVDQVEAVG